MTIDAHLTEFFGKPVQDFKPGEALDLQVAAPRLAVDYDDYFGSDASRNTWAKVLDVWLKTPGAGATTHLVAGAYEGFEGDMDAKMAIGPLVERRAELPNLQALFLGDITYDECELSWIQQQDAAPVLEAFPNLRAFGLRGYLQNLGAKAPAGLESLTLQSSGLSKAALAQVLALEAPALKHLELWTGSEDYGAETSVEDLAPLFAGEAFPHLTHLALRDSMYADEIAKAVAASPLFGRLEILDLSMGTLGDAGAAALLEVLPGSKLRKLILDHHYMTDAMMEKLKAFGALVSMEGQREEEDVEGGRYVAVAE